MKVWSAEDYAAREFEQPAWLVPQLIPGYGILMLYAHPKTGKSILSQQLAHELGCGGMLLGHKVQKTLKVLYVQSDLPEMEWAEQMKLLGVCPSCQVPFTKGWDTTWVEPGWLAQKPKAELEIKNTIAAGKYDLVMLDSLAKISRGIDLNDGAGVQRILAALEKLTPKPIWLIAHKRKGTPGVPDKANVASVGHNSLAAGVSVLLDLTAATKVTGILDIQGRFVQKELNLVRGPAGIWLPAKDVMKG